MESGWRVPGDINDFRGVWTLPLAFEGEWRSLTAFRWGAVTMGEMLCQGLSVMEKQAEEGATVRPLAVRAVLRVGHLLVLACLLAVDWYHVYSLRVKAGERAVPRTNRGTIPREQRRRISERQGNLCMYCGVDLLRLNVSQRHIDHKDPVERGGPDVEDNMQALCGRCNSRKGVQTDGEFRERYQELLRGGRPGRPPSPRITQARFVEVSKKTRQRASTEAARKAVFKTPAQKISSASVTAGIALGVVLFFVVALSFQNTGWGGTVAFCGAVVVFALTWVGSMWRARFTGMLDSEYVDKGILNQTRSRRR